MAHETEQRGKSRSWLSFTLGVAVGVALSGLLVAGVLAERRRARGVLPWSRRRASRTSPAAPEPASTAAESPSPDGWDNDDLRAARHWPEDAELDEELKQTFPASDPLPYSHRVD